MSNQSPPRKCVFNLFPAHSSGDKVACDLIDTIPLKERGRIMRAMLLTGAAFMLQDKRIPGMISEFLTDKTAISDIQRVISSVLPDAWSNTDEETMRDIVERLSMVTRNGETQATITGTVDKAAQATRANSTKLFPDEDE